jgi:hypothetical protein
MPFSKVKAFNSGCCSAEVLGVDRDLRLKRVSRHLTEFVSRFNRRGSTGADDPRSPGRPTDPSS